MSYAELAPLEGMERAQLVDLHLHFGEHADDQVYHLEGMEREMRDQLERHPDGHIYYFMEFFYGTTGLSEAIESEQTDGIKSPSYAFTDGMNAWLTRQTKSSLDWEKLVSDRLLQRPLYWEQFDVLDRLHAQYPGRVKLVLEGRDMSKVLDDLESHKGVAWRATCAINSHLKFLEENNLDSSVVWFEMMVSEDSFLFMRRQRSMALQIQSLAHRGDAMNVFGRIGHTHSTFAKEFVDAGYAMHSHFDVPLVNGSPDPSVVDEIILQTEAGKQYTREEMTRKTLEYLLAWGYGVVHRNEYFDSALRRTSLAFARDAMAHIFPDRESIQLFRDRLPEIGAENWLYQQASTRYEM